jgi:hypothetical protein
MRFDSWFITLDESGGYFYASQSSLVMNFRCCPYGLIGQADAALAQQPFIYPAAINAGLIMEAHAAGSSAKTVKSTHSRQF